MKDKIKGLKLWQILILIAAVAMLGIAGFLLLSGNGKRAEDQSPMPTETPIVIITPTPAPENVNDPQTALSMAVDYIAANDVSEKKLTEWLKGEGFGNDSISYAVSNVTVNWYEEAIDCARSYMETTRLEGNNLYHQLRFEGFTKKQAKKALKKVEGE